MSIFGLLPEAQSIAAGGPRQYARALKLLAEAYCKEHGLKLSVWQNETDTHTHILFTVRGKGKNVERAVSFIYGLAMEIDRIEQKETG